MHYATFVYASLWLMQRGRRCASTFGQQGRRVVPPAVRKHFVWVADFAACRLQNPQLTPRWPSRRRRRRAM